MTRFSLYPLSLALAWTPVPAAAQAMVQAIPGTTDADRLAAQMRLLAGNANDLSALLAAGELSLKLDDLGAAASFFARADKVDPRNGRAKAGEAAILVHAERPGEALRYFAMAESYGLAPAAFAADRGLAYDLIGENERAQRDYRLALRTAPDEETQRRYALSLAIAGKRDLSDQQLQPLLRRSDRAAWRARAFALAMGGNVAEASRIATTMMPPGTAAGLQPFLERLPTLGPVDRAFAVHFGEVRSTPQRVADARLVPALAALGPDPYAPRVQVAAATPVTTDRDRKRKDKDKGKAKNQPAAVQVAVATPAPVPLPQAPAYRPTAAAPTVLASRAATPVTWSAPAAVVQPLTVTPASSPMQPVRPAPSVQPGFTTAAAPVVARTPVVAVPITPVTPRPSPTVAAVQPTGSPPPESNVVVGAASTEALGPVSTVAAAAPTVAPTAVVATTPAPATSVSGAAATPIIVPQAVARTAPTASVPVAAAPAPTASSIVAQVQPIPTPPLPQPAAIAPTARPAALPPEHAVPPRHRDTLSGILAGLPIPAAELGVVGPARPSSAVEARTPEPPARDLAAERAAAAKALADKRAADRKAAAEKKALAEKKASAAEKAEEQREAAAQKKLERANPERIWVQVAGGANEDDLPKAWAAVKAKGGDAFAGHATGWTTPLRFTHRVLAGPFKTDAEARAFVNTLKGEGVSAFTFTSDAGQAVTRLSAK